MLEFAIAQQRRSHAAGTDQKGVVDVVPAEKFFQFAGHIGHDVADARPAGDAHRLQILAHLRGIQIQILADIRAGNRLMPRRLPLFQEAVIQRQPLQGRFGNDLRRRPLGAWICGLPFIS